MSPERDLLKKILATGWLNNTISCEVEELLAQPETKQDLKLEWYKRGYKQGFVDGQDVPHRKLDYFTDIILGEDDE
jgi:hypothetical protein